MAARVTVVVAAALVLCGGRLVGQGDAAAPGYIDRYREIAGLAPLPNQAAPVTGLILRREAAVLTLERGVLYLLTPVGGRTVGAVFEGTGRFALTPPTAVEAAQLERFTGSPILDDTITRAVLLFADSTPEELRSLTFGPGPVPEAVGDAVRDLIGKLQGDHEGSFHVPVLAPLLNGERNGFFLAHVRRTRGDPVLFEVNPEAVEAVGLSRPVGKLRWGGHWTRVTQFPGARPAAGTAGAWFQRNRLSVPSYELEVRLTPTGLGDLTFAARATLRIAAQEAVGPWLRFGLHRELTVDSARWGDGTSVSSFKAKDDDDLWVRAPRRFAAGDSATLTLYYAGDLIDRYDNWFYIDPLADWWPANGQGQDLATFDITYHSPSWYPIASIGDRVDSVTEGRVMTTRWVARRPTPYATFNLGLFDERRVQHEGAPEIRVLISETAHRVLRHQLQERGFYLSQQANMSEAVAADVSNSLKLFAHHFGPAPYERFYVTEIPYLLGVSFPGVIHMSWTTFHNTSLAGFDEYFRAHEAAHQWWGNGVRPASYHDAWLSEGIATFCGLWYLQTVRKRNDEYFRFLAEYETNIRGNRNDVGPIWLGYRNATPVAPAGYHAMVYEKGAWVMHMLRTLMLDLQTKKEDRFQGMMRDFYSSNQGGTASTDGFQAVVERHVGIPMGWFFDQWVRGTAIPTYRVAWRNDPAEGGRHRVRLRVIQEDVPAAFQAYVLVSADLGENRFANFRLNVNGSQTEYVSPLLPAPAKRVTFNELRSVLADVKSERW